MNKPIPIFETIERWDNIILITDKDDFQYEITNVGGFENAFWLKHKFDSFCMKYLNDHTFGQYAMDEEKMGFNMCGELNDYFKIPENEKDFTKYFKLNEEL